MYQARSCVPEVKLFLVSTCTCIWKDTFTAEYATLLPVTQKIIRTDIYNEV